MKDFEKVLTYLMDGMSENESNDPFGVLNSMFSLGVNHEVINASVNLSKEEQAELLELFGAKCREVFDDEGA